jgi:peptidoglycan/LPS O-acetylase OafA/YrhL
MGFLQHMRYFNIAIFLIVPSVLLVGWLDRAHNFQPEIKPLRWIGDTTYSVYLWHFPIQVAILTAVEYFGLGRAGLHSPLGLILWIGGILTVGHISFRVIERPLQVRVKAVLPRLFAFVRRGVRWRSIPTTKSWHRVTVRRSAEYARLPEQFRSPRVTKPARTGIFDA